MMTSLNHIKRIVLSAVLVLFSSNIFAQDWIYTVVEGDNLWNLSQKHLDKVTRFEQVRKLNGITNPKHLQPGTHIRIPLKWIRSNAVPARVLSLDGSAELQKADKQSTQALNIGSTLYLGDEIRTGKNSSIAIIFADDTILTIHENSLIRFDHLSAHGVTGMVDTRLNLIKGRTDTKVTPAKGPGSRFEIQTPSAISAVRGTVYRISVSENGEESNIEVLQGKVAVSGGSKQRLISAGYGTQVAVGTPPLPQRSLLSSPNFDAIPKTIEQINRRVSWSAIQGAENYRVELANDAKFDTLLWQTVSQYNHASLPDVPDGNYTLRVRAIDSLGIEGLNQDTLLILNAHPQPPIALTPIDGQILRGQTPALQWTGSEDASKYHLEIATDADFTQLVFDNKNITTTHYKPSSLTENRVYFWRLASIAEDGERGAVGPIRSYQIKPIPDKIDVTITSEDDVKLIASWKPSSNQQQYQIQIANDKSFSNIVTDKIVSKPLFEIPPVEDRTRYLRVKSIEDDGYEGPWGVTQSIAPPPKEVSYWPFAIGTIFTILVL